ncbi:dipeptide/oligopeptide/nickel ABC transporter permease/ATP-binding protein [Zafaria sp. Z1313]|uniref:dipeptide/oligopeptide/nickel ABC transporter permease/ATP-binding protein n=1 Tax=unclassified Zafaria TaxID=2828765 RepID=UPI002E763EDD|nr:dipeptide/oligopeptide/nickel ABC transporter permease/ATP-binding protein [Zafaria sp. J156]MEE1621800.1 dipeptide/oligopeptide/nickel ABC transporter permease/ATP-binding protein [Zafaria sp. J156]
MTQVPSIQAGTTAAAVKRAGTLKRLLTNPMAIVALFLLVVVGGACALAPLLATHDPNTGNLAVVLQGPGGEHLLGTDSAGRDVFSRLLFAGQTTLAAGLLAAAVAIAIGTPAGIAAGYYGGRLDSAASWIANMLMSLPGIIILLAVRAATGPSVWLSMVVFGVLLAPSFFRLTRTAVQSVRNELYVDAARVSGLSDWRIMSRHVFSVVRAPIIIQTAMVAGIAIAIQSVLEFLGLGDPLVPTWGVMMSDAFRNVYLQPLLLVWPGLAIAAITVGLALLGNALRDALEDGQKSPKAPKRPKAPRAAASPHPRQDAAAVAAAADPGGKGSVLSVKGLRVGYPQEGGTLKTVVEDVSLHVDKGEVLGIVGESGSGKSQTAFSILGLLPETARVTDGTILFEGEPLLIAGDDARNRARIAKLRGRGIGYIPQEPMSNLDPAFTVGYQLVRPMVKVLGLSKAEARKRALGLLATVGIVNPQRTFDAYPHEISGGMAQRVLIAGAVSCEPRLLIADEPTTALDVTVQAEVLDLLRELRERLGMGLLMVTHNFGVVSDLCDRVVVMRQGTLVEEGDVRSLLRNPQHEYTQQLLASTLEGKEPMTMLTGSSSPVPASEPEDDAGPGPGADADGPFGGTPGDADRELKGTP